MRYVINLFARTDQTQDLREHMHWKGGSAPISFRRTGSPGILSARVEMPDHSRLEDAKDVASGLIKAGFGLPDLMWDNEDNYSSGVHIEIIIGKAGLV